VAFASSKEVSPYITAMEAKECGPEQERVFRGRGFGKALAGTRKEQAKTVFKRVRDHKDRLFWWKTVVAEVVELLLVSLSWGSSSGTFDWLLPLLFGFQFPMFLINLVLTYLVTRRVENRERLVIAMETNLEYDNTLDEDLAKDLIDSITVEERLASTIFLLEFISDSVSMVVGLMVLRSEKVRAFHSLRADGVFQSGLTVTQVFVSGLGLSLAVNDIHKHYVTANILEQDVALKKWAGQAFQAGNVIGALILVSYMVKTTVDTSFESDYGEILVGTELDRACVTAAIQVLPQFALGLIGSLFCFFTCFPTVASKVRREGSDPNDVNVKQQLNRGANVDTDGELLTKVNKQVQDQLALLRLDTIDRVLRSEMSDEDKIHITEILKRHKKHGQQGQQVQEDQQGQQGQQIQQYNSPSGPVPVAVGIQIVQQGQQGQQGQQDRQGQEGQEGPHYEQPLKTQYCTPFAGLPMSLQQTSSVQPTEMRYTQPAAPSTQQYPPFAQAAPTYAQPVTQYGFLTPSDDA
jgi:hypothetical protein